MHTCCSFETKNSLLHYHKHGGGMQNDFVQCWNDNDSRRCELFNATSNKLESDLFSYKLFSVGEREKNIILGERERPEYNGAAIQNKSPAVAPLMFRVTAGRRPTADEDY
jgi:hypothetical protein